MIKQYPKFFISLICIFLAAAIHIYAKMVPLSIHSNTITLGLYTVVIIFWIQKNRRMILHKEMRKYLIYIGYLLIAYLFLRTVKYDLVAKGSPFERYLWYCYYIILIAIGVFLLFSVLYIDKGRNEKIDSRWHLVYVLLFIFSLLFMTNDHHQMIFTFPDGLDHWSDSSNGYGYLFYAMVAYCGAIIFATFFISTKKLLDSRNVKNIFITFAVPILWGLYTYFYLIRASHLTILFVAFKSPEFNCLITILYIESLIYNRLIPVNFDYEKFWDMSTLDIGIMNHDGVRHSKNPSLKNIERDLIEKAEGSPLLIDENTLLESAKISSGYTYWFSDISQINHIKKELKNFGDLIAEENELLKAENQLKKEHASIKKQIEIYEFIDSSLEDKILALERSLDTLSDDEDDFNQGMTLATMINVYIKRFSNMLLLSQKSKTASVMELRLAIGESLRYLTIFDVMTDLSWAAKGDMSLDNMLLLYKTFEEVIEGNINSMSAALVTVKLEGKEMILSMAIENPDAGYHKKAFFSKNFSCDAVVEEGILFVRATVSLGSDHDGNL